VSAITSLFAPKPPKLPPGPPAPTPDSPEVLAAKAAELERRKKRQGFASTILTGATGVLSPAPTVAKTLLGQ
jgi:hypothetical protein